MGKDALTPERLAELQKITDRAQAGDESAAPRLRELLAEYPEMATYNGDLGNQAIAIWIDLAAGKNLLLRESLSCRVAQLRRELAGESPSPIMELLADRVVMTWMSVNYFTGMEGNALRVNENPKMLSFRTKRRLQAERAHLTALAALATMKKLYPTAPVTASAKEPPALPAAAGLLNPANRIGDYFADLLGPNSDYKSRAVATN